MKKKKGFTLVELLAVIVIIVIVATIATTSMMIIKKKMQKKTFEETLKTVLVTAETFGSDNKETLDNLPETEVIKIDGTERKYYVTTVGDLLETKYYESENKDAEGKATINYYEDNSSINDLQILIYETGENDRVNACIPSVDMDGQFNGNLEIIKDVDKEQFGDLGVYCTKTSVPGRTTIITLALTHEDAWSTSKKLDITITIPDSDAEIAGYKISNTKNCKDGAAWIIPTGNKSLVNDTVEYTTELDETGKKVYVCAKNSEGETKSASITVNKIDNTAPLCGNSVNEKTIWTKEAGTVEIECNDALSGCVQEKYSKTFSSSDTSGKGIIEIADNAGNKTSCELNVYIDTTPPTCDIQGENDEWTKYDVTLTYGCNDTESGCTEATYGSKTYSTGTIKTTTADSYTISDKAGNTTECGNTEVDIYLDKDAPTCNITGENTTWTKQNVPVVYGCTDAGSGCKEGKSGSSATVSETRKTYTIPTYEIEDNVGNKTTCAGRELNVYVDKTAPTCEMTGENTNWTNQNVTINYGCKDTESGCKTGKSGSSTTITSNGTTAAIPAYTIEDNAGNTTNCPSKNAKVYIDKTAPTCTITATSSGLSLTKSDTGGSGIAAYGLANGSQTYNSAASASLAAGTFYGVVRDNAGNSASCTKSIANTSSSSCNCSNYTYNCGTESYSYSCKENYSYSCPESYTYSCPETYTYACNQSYTYSCQQSYTYSCQQSYQYACTKTSTYSCTKSYSYACGQTCTRKCCYRHGSYICDEYDCGKTCSTKYCTGRYTTTCSTTYTGQCTGTKTGTCTGTRTGTCTGTRTGTCTGTRSATCTGTRTGTCTGTRTGTCTGTRNATCYGTRAKTCTGTSCDTCYSCGSGYTKLNNSYCAR